MISPDSGEEAERRRATALLLAHSDMEQVVHTCNYLLGEHPTQREKDHAGGVPWQVRRALEAGFITCYARPFTISHGGYQVAQSGELTPEEQELHKWLLDQRDKVYAHNDETDYRQMLGVDGDDWRERLKTRGGLSESWIPPTEPARLRTIRALAESNMLRLDKELDALADGSRVAHRACPEERLSASPPAL